MSGAQDSLALARDLSAQLSLVDDELDASESESFSLIGPPSVGSTRNPMSLRSTTRVTRGAGSGEDDLSSVGRRPPLGGGSRVLGLSGKSSSSTPQRRGSTLYSQGGGWDQAGYGVLGMDSLAQSCLRGGEVPHFHYPSFLFQTRDRWQAYASLASGSQQGFVLPSRVLRLHTDGR